MSHTDHFNVTFSPDSAAWAVVSASSVFSAAVVSAAVVAAAVVACQQQIPHGHSKPF